MSETPLKTVIATAVHQQFRSTIEPWQADEIGELCEDIVEAALENLEPEQVDEPVTSFSLRRELNERIRAIVTATSGEAGVRHVTREAFEQIRQAGEDYLAALEAVGLLPYGPSWRVKIHVKEPERIELAFERLDVVGISTSGCFPDGGDVRECGCREGLQHTCGLQFSDNGK